MRKLLGVMSLFIALGLGSGAAMAGTTSTGYNSSGDTYVNLSTGGTSPLGSSLGTFTFNTQESLYSTTGTSLDHDYVWLEVDGQPVLALDPPSPMIN
ncbi:MAG: hypothetical protein K6T30_01485 [Alicyclobacillus sp.]|nr:hypothetical protein [Alicyclobacillus sp.]